MKVKSNIHEPLLCWHLKYRTGSTTRKLLTDIKKRKRLAEGERVCYYRYRPWTKKRKISGARSWILDVREMKENTTEVAGRPAQTRYLPFPALFSAFNFVHPFSPWPYSLIFSRHYRFTKMLTNV